MKEADKTQGASTLFRYSVTGSSPCFWQRSKALVNTNVIWFVWDKRVDTTLVASEYPSDSFCIPPALFCLLFDFVIKGMYEMSLNLIHWLSRKVRSCTIDQDRHEVEQRLELEVHAARQTLTATNRPNL